MATMGDPAAAEAISQVAALLGGPRVLRRSPVTPLDVHRMLLEGLPSGALTHLVCHFAATHRADSLEKAVGISLRTFQRRQDTPARPLSQEQSGRTWKFAEILARAIAVFGSREEAEAWMDRPATGLDRQRPIDLLATPVGVGLVEDFLQRLEYGVYT